MALLSFPKCRVQEVAVKQGGTVTMSLSDLGETPQFDHQWFVAINEARREMLAIALVAMTSGLAVDVDVQSLDPNAFIESLGLLRVSS